MILFVNKRLSDFALVENALGVDYSALTVPVLLVSSEESADECFVVRIVVYCGSKTRNWEP